MALYRMSSGVVVDIPEAKAARIGGLTPADPAPAAAPVKKTPPVKTRAPKVGED